MLSISRKFIPRKLYVLKYVDKHEHYVILQYYNNCKKALLYSKSKRLVKDKLILYDDIGVFIVSSLYNIVCSNLLNLVKTCIQY